MDTCESCGSTGSMDQPTRTQAGGNMLEYKAKQGYTFANQVMRPEHQVSRNEKRKMDEILATKDMTKKQKALAVASEAGQVSDFHLVSGWFSASTIACYSSKCFLYEQIMEASKMPAWPVTAASITRFAGVLKCTNYVGARTYLSAVISSNAVMGYQLSDSERHVTRLANRSCKRDSEEHDNFKDPITLEHLERMEEVIKGKDRSYRALVARLAVLMFFFLLRPREALSLTGWCDCSTCSADKCKCKADVNLGKQSCWIKIRGDKTEQSGSVITRKLRCVCGGKQMSREVPICPVCCLRKIRMESKMTVDDRHWKLAAGSKDKPLAYDGFHKMLMQLMEDIGEDIYEDDGHTKKYGGQSLRRGGAQRLALEGTPVHLIKLWGRWESFVVFRYILECPLESLDVAKVMTKGGQEGLVTSKFQQGQEVLVPCREHDTWVSGKVVERDGEDVIVQLKSTDNGRNPAVIKVDCGRLVAM